MNISNPNPKPTRMDEHFEAVLQDRDLRGDHLRAIRSISSEHSSNGSKINEILQRYTPQQIRDAFFAPRSRIEEDEFSRRRNYDYESAHTTIEILSKYYFLEDQYLNSEHTSRLEPHIKENLRIDPSEMSQLEYDDRFRISHTMNTLSRTFLGKGAYRVYAKNMSRTEAQIIYIKDIFRDINLVRTMKALGFDFKKFADERVLKGDSQEDAAGKVMDEIVRLFAFVRRNTPQEDFDRYDRAYNDTLPFRFGERSFEPLFSEIVLELNPEDYEKVIRTLTDIKKTKFAEYGSWYNAMLQSRLNSQENNE